MSRLVGFNKLAALNGNSVICGTQLVNEVKAYLWTLTKKVEILTSKKYIELKYPIKNLKGAEHKIGKHSCISI